MGVRERKVENYLRDELKKINGTSRKWVSPGRDGVPDQIVRLLRWATGVVHVVEVKTTDGTLEPSQERELPRLTEEGFLVFIVYGHEGVDKYIRSIDV